MASVCRLGVKVDGLAFNLEVYGDGEGRRREDRISEKRGPLQSSGGLAFLRRMFGLHCFPVL